jgi:co-chaperonin GroES (HSP10)
MVLIEPLTEENKTPSGIILIEQVRKRKPRLGIVRRVEKDQPMKEGEKVLYPVGLGTEVSLIDEGVAKSFEILRAVDIWLVV